MARRDLFTGRAGAHAVISQLLIREWQVAAPEVDIGDDLLIAMDLARILRVQVKTCRVREKRNSYLGRFRLSVEQVARPSTPELVFVFALYRNGTWADFLVIPRRDLLDETTLHNVGGRGGHINLYIRLTDTTVQCQNRDWSHFRNAWTILSGSPSARRAA